MSAFQFCVVLLVPSCLVFTASAATVVFDDFSSAPFEIGSGGPGSATEERITSPFADRRAVFGSGAPVWDSQLDIDSRILTYSFDLPRGDVPWNQSLSLSYFSSSGSLDFQGYDGFVIRVESVAGRGEVLASFGSNVPGASVIPVQITGPGDLLIPFDFMGDVEPSSTNNVVFRIVPLDPTFSVTISGISVIPEPSVAGLTALGLLGLLAGRRR